MNFALEDIPMHLNLGVPKEERANVQEVLVSVYFSCDVSTAEQSDNIDDAVDYAVIYDVIKSFSERHGEVKLLEKLQSLLRADILSSIQGIENLNISIRKFPFPEGSVLINDF